MFDPTGPGTPAWEASDRAVNHGVMGRYEDMQRAIDEMTQHLIDNNTSAADIRAWEQYIAERILEACPDDMDD